MSQRAAQTYRKVHLESAPPARLLDELLARAIRDLDVGAECLGKRDIAGKARELGHALEIVDELLIAVDPAAAPELGANLMALYDFVRLRIVDASVRLDAAPLEGARRVLVTLREAFQGVAP